MKNILVYGLQRSGTNFLEKLLLKNYKIRILNNNNDEKHPLQKHFRLFNDKMFIGSSEYENEMIFKNFLEYENALNLPKKVDGILIISKDPFSWLISYKNWAKKHGWPSPKYHYIEEYNRFYGKWAEFSKEDNRILFIKYIDLLSQTDKEIGKIEKTFYLELKKQRQFFGKLINFSRVGRSKKFNQDKRNYYLNKEYLKQYDKRELELLNTKTDPKLMCFLKYDNNKI